ncbi:unnamed protein product [Anisakis simplex]|uniref:Uncharacterized protein n=1 Tax=Anisakis simplex TaxID=6269 RepID=A0A0M3K4A6_ANISI|nr:unnamed protein product [Anisakis simplex]
MPSSPFRCPQEVEGSGGGPPASSYDAKKKNLAAADIEWEASGIGPDDEDGDVVEGSGDDEVHGSGDGPPPVRIPPVVIQHTTTTATQPPAVSCFILFLM